MAGVTKVQSQNLAQQVAQQPKNERQAYRDNSEAIITCTEAWKKHSPNSNFLNSPGRWQPPKKAGSLTGSDT